MSESATAPTGIGRAGRQIERLPEISARTGVPIETLRWLRKNRKGPKTFVLAGRVVAFVTDVDEWIRDAAARESA